MEFEVEKIRYFWLAAALGLGILEIFTGAFFFLFLAIAAGLLAVLSFVLPILLRFDFSLIFFGMVSLVLVAALRGRMRNWSVKNSKGFRADQVSFVVQVAIAAGGEGWIKYQGSEWTAKNIGDADIVPLDTVRVERTEGNKLLLRKI